MHVGEAIREARGSRDQTWLATELSVHQSTISDWERGRSAPRPEKFRDIEKVLGMPPGTLARIRYGDPDLVFDDGTSVQYDAAGSTLDLSGLTDSQRDAIRRMADEFHKTNEPQGS